jgi:hypothetical protein
LLVRRAASSMASGALAEEFSADMRKCIPDLREAERCANYGCSINRSWDTNRMLFKRAAVIHRVRLYEKKAVA